MAVVVASLMGVLKLDDTQFRRGVQGARSEMTNLRSPMQSMVSNVQSAGKVVLASVAGIAAGVGVAGAALLDMAKDASVLEGVEEAFDGLVTSTGRGSREMLRSLTEASAGMANQQELMLSYNKAAQLVSTTFANQLPDAMDELTKVASATGQDMGFLIDSLVVGVGRLSPMILDNLGIQVSLTEAYEAYAASIGKSADELSKAEQQTALMNQVMEKLEENTANLPDVLGQTDTKMAQFESRMENIRFEIGRRVLPVFDGLITAANGVAAAFELLVTGDFTQSIGDALGGAAEDSPIIVFLLELREGIQAIMAGVPVFDVLANLLGEVAASAAAYGDLPLVDFLLNLRDVVVETLKPIGDWINENIRLEDVLLALGIAAASVVVPAILSIVAAAAPIVLTIAGLIAAVTLLRSAWENDFLGIRTFITEQALPAIVDFIETTAIPGIEALFTFLGDAWETVRPELELLWDWFTVTALPAVVDFVENTVQPAVQDFIDILEGIWVVVSVGLQALENWFTTTGGPAINTATDLVHTKVSELQTTLEGIWEAVRPLIEPMVNWFRDTFQWIGELFIKPVIDFIKDIIEQARLAIELLRQLGGGEPHTVEMSAGRHTVSFGANAGIRDSGGLGFAGQSYAIGPQQANNEIFVPSTDGTFIPNFIDAIRQGGGGGVTIQSMNVYTDNAEDFMRQMEDIRRRRG